MGAIGYRIVRRLSLVVILALTASVAGVGRAAVLPAAAPPASADEAGLKQFTSRGHVLGFDRDGYYVSNGTYALRVQFEGARLVAPVAAGAAAEGADKKAVPLSRVDYPDLWPGIGVTYDAPGSGIARSTWSVQPGADPSAIRLHYNQKVEVAKDGSLGVGFETGRMNESRPVAWQDVNGQLLAKWVQDVGARAQGVSCIAGHQREIVM